MNTYWVQYKYDFDYLENDGKWENWNDYGAERFQCLKKDLKKAVRERVIEDECLVEGKYRKLKIDIIEEYITTDCEV